MPTADLPDIETDGASELLLLREIAERLGNNDPASDANALNGLLRRLGTAAAPQPIYSPGAFLTASGSFSRPANTTAYAAFQRIADLTAAATVLEIPGCSRAIGEAVRIERLRLRKTGPSLVNASFKVHLFRLLPTVNVNDAGVFNASGAGTLAVADIAGHVGTFAATMDVAGVAGAQSIAVPLVGPAVTCIPAGPTGKETSMYAVLEATAAYTPVSGETFTVTLEFARP